MGIHTGTRRQCGVAGGFAWGVNPSATYVSPCLIGRRLACCVMDTLINYMYGYAGLSCLNDAIVDSLQSVLQTMLEP